MLMKYILPLIAILVVVLVACSPAEVPVENTTTTEANSCDSINCSADQQCQNGSCVCGSGLTSCNGKCIPSSSCCSDANCNSKESCISGVCKQRELCKYGEEYKDGKCGCAQDFKQCGEQHKCIPYDKCCGISACNPEDNYDRVCVDTNYGAQLCFNTATGSHCRYAYLDERTSFSVGKEGADVTITKIFEDKSINAEISQRGVKTNITMLKPENTAAIAKGALLKSNFIATSGGNCRSEATIEPADNITA